MRKEINEWKELHGIKNSTYELGYRKLDRGDNSEIISIYKMHDGAKRTVLDLFINKNSLEEIYKILEIYNFSIVYEELRKITKKELYEIASEKKWSIADIGMDIIIFQPTAFNITREQSYGYISNSATFKFNEINLKSEGFSLIK